MNQIKPAIYLLIAIGLLTLSLEMVINRFNVSGFNKAILIIISGLMAVIMFSVSWVMWKKVLSNENNNYSQLTWTLRCVAARAI